VSVTVAHVPLLYYLWLDGGFSPQMPKADDVGFVVENVALDLSFL
jgi:hypothetical protein